MHFILSADGFQRVTSELFTDDDKYVDSDVVFGVKDSLIVHYDEHTDVDEAKNLGVNDVPYYTLEFDFSMVPGRGNEIQFSAGRDDATAWAKQTLDERTHV